uniref:CHRD domain-containing protein n=1 Tax=Lotharella globosa TaxID=91324 RepID=A0A7S3ZDZ9_9EUKA
MKLVASILLTATVASAAWARETSSMEARVGENPFPATPRCFEALSTPEQEVTVENGTNVILEVDSNGQSVGRLNFEPGLRSAFFGMRLINLVGNVDRIHIHCNASGFAGALAVDVVSAMETATIPLSQLSDQQNGQITGTITNKNIVTGNACADLGIINIAGLKSAALKGLLYFNVHTDVFPSGELRGQIYASNDACVQQNQ